MDADEHTLSLALTLVERRCALRYTYSVAQTYTAVIQYDAESQAYVGFIPALPGTHSCAASLEELRANLREAIELMLATIAEDAESSIGLGY